MLGTMNRLTKYKLVYMATPYTKYYAGQENAANDAAKICAKLLVAGVPVYSPIVYTHQVAIHGCVDPLDHKIWLPFDQPFMDACECLLVIKMPGWDASYGIAHEIKDFTTKRKDILYLDPASMLVTKEP